MTRLPKHFIDKFGRQQELTDDMKKFRRLASQKASNANYCAKWRKATGLITSARIIELFGLQRGKCVYCKKDLNRNFHVDHIIPITLGGENIDSNIQLLDLACNYAKRAKHPIVFANEIGLLL